MCDSGVHLEFLTGGKVGGTDHEAVYNLCSILKIMSRKSCRKYNCNVTLFATHVYTCEHNYIFCYSVVVTILLLLFY
jgi:hypothetical protein